MSALNLYNFVFFFNDTATTEIYTLSLHDALPIWLTVPQLVNSSLTICRGTNHPRNKHVNKPPTGRKICPVTKSNQSNKDLPPKLRKSTAPSDSEQNAPIIQVVTVTMTAPRFLEIWSSS